MAGEVKHGEKREKRAAEMAICACGCGQSFEKYDDHGRPRKYAKRSHQWTEERKAKMMGYAKKNGLGKYERPTPSPPRQP